MCIFKQACLLLLIFLCATPLAQANPRIAIIIDDFGYSQHLDKAAIALPFPITCSIIPGAPNSVAMAKLVAKSGKEVLLHIPMATIDHRRLDPGGLHDGVTQTQINHTITQALRKIPQAVGLNNHMGSLLTSERQPMTWLMQRLKHDHLFFIDSLTTSHSVAGAIAKKVGIPSSTRDIFLDDNPHLAAINKQFNRLLKEARRHGSAIAIGHPYSATLRYLKQVLPLLPQAGIKLVPVSALLSGYSPPRQIVRQTSTIHKGNTHNPPY